MQKLIARVLICGVTLLFSLYQTEASVVRAEGVYSGIGTGDGLDGSNDAINFSQGRVWTIDQYGKYIWMTQVRGGESHWAWSNDNGANWSQGAETYTFLMRSSVAYDSINDKLHVIWTATDSGDGIIYRRYGITRDGSHAITAITREDSGNINLQLDTSGSRAVEQAAAYWVNDGSANGILIAAWSKNGGALNEARASMRKLTLSAADGVAGNWVALDGVGDAFATDPPQVAADKIYTAGSGSNALSIGKRGGSGAHADDFYIFVATSATDQVLAYRAAWKSSTGDWGNGWTALGQVGAMNTTSGYSLKHQLITKPVLDTTNDRLYVGWARWKDGTNGDTASIAYLTSADAASATIDVYSALGPHSYAPTIDIAYDLTMERVYIAYIESTTNGDNGSIDYATYDGAALSTSTRFYTSPGGSAGANGSADIPILYESRQNGRLLFAYRVNGALPPTAGSPHTIDWGYVTLPTPTPTPTPTPSPASSSSTEQSSSGPSQPLPPTCSAIPPGEPSPHIYADRTTATSATIFFTEAAAPFSEYVFSYGMGSSSTGYGATILTGPGLRTFTINDLMPNATYTVKIRAGNGCAVGPWSAERSVSTKRLLPRVFASLLPIVAIPSAAPIFAPLSPTPSALPQATLVPSPLVPSESVSQGFFQTMWATILRLLRLR